MMNRMMQGWQKTPKWAKIIGMIILGVAAAVLFGFVFGFLVMYLWNWLMPELFSLKEITYWQAFGIVVLTRLLFGSVGGSKDHDSKSSKKKKKQLNCEDEEQCAKGEWKNWKHYDEWWDAEGKEAFEEYVDKKKEDKESKAGPNQNS